MSETIREYVMRLFPKVMLSGGDPNFCPYSLFGGFDKDRCKKTGCPNCWSLPKEHFLTKDNSPAPKTFLDKYLARFPNAPLTDGGVPYMCRYQYADPFGVYSYKNRCQGRTCKQCWEEPCHETIYEIER